MNPSLAVVPLVPRTMIPAEPQRLWGWPAVANFALGGLGAGWYVVAALAAGLDRTPGVTVASWLAPALVATGLATVAGEAGRPRRGARVLARVGTSWMSRELWLGIVFVGLVAADLVSPQRLCRALAVAAAVLLPLTHGFILRRARGVTAWDVPLVPPALLLSALASGAGAYLVVETLAGRRPAGVVVGAVLMVVVASFTTWTRYLTWRRDEAHRQAVAPLREGLAQLAIEGGGHGAPLVLGLWALALPGAAAPLLALAGALLVGGHVYAKARLVLAAGWLRPVTLAIALPRSVRMNGETAPRADADARGCPAGRSRDPHSFKAPRRRSS